MIAVSWGKCTPVERKPIPSLREIAEQVCKFRGVSMIDFMSSRKTKSVARARQEAYWRARHETTASLPQIGSAYGNRDHTTVLFGIRAHERRLQAGANGAA
jgi:chromosomal replication initiator protein